MFGLEHSWPVQEAIAFAHTVNGWGKEWWGLLLVAVIVAKLLACLLRGLWAQDKRRIERDLGSRGTTPSLTLLKTDAGEVSSRSSRALGHTALRHFERPMGTDHVL